MQLKSLLRPALYPFLRVRVSPAQHSRRGPLAQTRQANGRFAGRRRSNA
jgi:hypothetical protein